MHPFRAFISLYTNLSDEDWNKIHSCINYKVIQQNRIIHKQGTICLNLYFLENGSIRYFKENEGKSFSIHFIQPPSLFTAAQSFANQIPSEYGIQALDESFVWVIKREDAYALLDIPAWNDFLIHYFSKT